MRSAVVVEVFVHIKLEWPCNCTDKVESDVASVLRLVHHVHAHGGEQVQVDQAAELAVDAGGGVDPLVHDVVEDR